MTCIVYRAGTLAGDGRETIQNHEGASTMILRDDCVKVWKLPNGCLLGAAHGSEDIERLRRALIQSRKPPKLCAKNGLAFDRMGAKKRPPKLDDVAALLIDHRGRAWLYEGRIWQRLDDAPYYAVGSGSIFAMPALDAGAGAERACKIGATRDPYSGGVIRTVSL